MKDKIFETLQRIGKTFMLPIALLPVAGLFLGIGASFISPTFVEMYNLQDILGEGTILYGFLSILNDCGGVVFENLGLLFAVSIALGLAKTEKGVAALSGVVGYFLMYASLTSAIRNFRDIDALSQIQGLLSNTLGFENTFNLGVFGGIIIGLIVANLHNKYYKVELPDALSFFGGTHAVPILSAVWGLITGIILAFVWPYVAAGIAGIGQFIAGTGNLGVFLYGYIYRALIPFGLHHVFYLPFWQTAIGGTAEIAGRTVVGAQNIVFEQLRVGDVISSDAARFFSFQFPEMLFGLPAAALAMYSVARDDKKDEVKGLLFSSALTSILTGITEPIEFTILFASPFLFWGIHCVLFALSAVFVSLLKVGVGVTFSGGLLDLILYGILPGNARTNWLPLIPLGIAYFVLYYFLFRWAIVKFDWETPGRGEDTGLKSKQDYLNEKDLKNLNENEQFAYQIVLGLGGTDNLIDVDNCATRLRVTVKDGEKVNQPLLSSTGAAGVVVRGNGVQVIYGTRVSTIKTHVTELIDAHKAPKEGVANEESVETVEEETQIEETDTSVETIPVAIESVATGKVINLEDVPDDVFSSKMMGDGFAVVPSENEVVSPVDATVLSVFPTKHAMGLQTKEGLELLIHMGLDTVELDGEGFTTSVEEGDEIKAGQPIATMDIGFIKSKGKDTDIIVIATNMDKVNNVEIEGNKEVTKGDTIGQINLKKD